MAGKAHPADQAGKAMIQEWMHFIQRAGARASVIFLSDYDMHLTEQLVQGVDVWLNTPRRPWEASGTSGMKVLVNGGINLSVLDGWWAEAYTPEVGWALGDGKEHGDDPAWDAIEAEALYDLLEHEVIPEFYTRDEQRHSHRLGHAHAQEHGAIDAPLFHQSRRARIYRAALSAGGGRLPWAELPTRARLGAQMVNWRHALGQKWPALRFGEMTVETAGEQHVFVVHVYFDDLDPGGGAGRAVCQRGFRESSGAPGDEAPHELVAAATGYAYHASVPADSSRDGLYRPAHTPP